MAEKNIIAVSVEDRFVNVADHTKVMAGNVGIDYVQIALDSEWDGLSVAVTFTGCAEESTTVDYTADPIAIPWEQIAEAGELHIGVRGTDPSGDVAVDTDEGTVTNSEVPTLNADTMLIPIQVFESGESGGQAPQQPSPTLLDRVQQDIVHLEGLVGSIDASADKADAAAEKAEKAAENVSAAVESATGAAALANAAATAANAAAPKAESAATAANEAATAANASKEKADTAAANADAKAQAAQTAADSANAATGAANEALSTAQGVASDVAGNAAAAREAAESATASKASASESAASASADAATATEKAASASSSETAATAAMERAEAAAEKAESIAGFTVEDAVTEGSKNPVTSGAVFRETAKLGISISENGDGYLVIAVGGK